MKNVIAALDRPRMRRALLVFALVLLGALAVTVKGMTDQLSSVLDSVTEEAWP